MTNTKIHWWKPEVDNKEVEFIKKVIKINYTNEGSFVKKLENNLKRIFKSKYAIATTSGTSALFLCLKAYGIKKGDEVIVPNITFVATANAVSLTGAKVVLVDVDKRNLSIDLSSLKKCINKKTKAIIPVHISGRSGNLLQIIKFAKKNKIKVIEDAAEAMFSKYKKKFLGTYGNCGCFSFTPNKIINSGQGGLIITNNKNIYNNIRKLKDQGRLFKGTGGDDEHKFIGYNFKYTNLQAATALAQLTKFTKRKKVLTRNYKFYEKNLIQNKNFFLIKQNIQDGNFPLWVDAYCKNRDKLVNILKKNNIETRNYWFPLNKNKPYKKNISFFKNSKLLDKKLFWLPSTFDMKISHLNKVCKIINNFTKKYND